jgi:hypothetical protein
MHSVKFFSAFLMICFLISCNRTDENNKAGKGGKASIQLTPRHHGIFKNIVDGKAYIKYNSKDLPSSYDDSVVVSYDAERKPFAIFSELKKGNYYIYVNAYDTLYKQQVKGGIPYEIMEDKLYEIDVPVTEPH